MTECYVAIDRSLSPDTLYVYARRTFDIERATSGAIRLAARQYAAIWLNGRYLGQTYVRTHPEEWRLQSFDLTPHLRVGRNVVALLVHGWGAPAIAIAGVPDPLPMGLISEGRAGACDFADLSAWRMAPASEYRPAPRIGSILGHEEYRDMRLEPAGWREPDFDDRAWRAPRIEALPESARVRPLPLRPLCEERVFPRRIVRQGAWLPGYAMRSVCPLKEPCYWRLQFEVGRCAEQDMLVWNGFSVPEMVRHWYRPAPAVTPLWVDGRRSDHAFPYLIGKFYEWTRLKWEPGTHTLTRPFEGVDWAAGWFGGASVRNVELSWGRTPDGPFEPASIAPDRDFRRILDRLDPLDATPPCRLENEGRLAWRVEKADASAVFEFERNMTLRIRLEIEDASPGGEIEIVFSERLSGRPELTVPAAYGDRVILRGGSQVYETAFQYKSAQVLILNVRARHGFVELGRLTGIFRHYDHDLAGEWRSSDPTLDRVWLMCRNTLEFGSQDAIVDGPWREQLLYMGDNFVQNQAAYHLFGNHELVEWQHLLYAAGQMPDGLIYPNQPYRPADRGRQRLLDQSVLWPILLAQHWLHTGRREFVAGLVPAMARLLDGFQACFGRLAAEGDPRLRDLPGWLWIDHQGVKDGEILSVRNDGISTGMNLLYLRALQSAGWLFRDLGQEPEALRFDALAQTLLRRLRRDHWDLNRHLFVDTIVDGRLSEEASLHVNLLSIEAAAADDPAALLARTWNVPGVLQLCGPHFHVHLQAVLDRLGRYDDLLQDIRELWGRYVADGLNSLPEYIPYAGEWGCSVGHAYGAAPSVYLVRSIAGLYPLAAGWSEMAFDPHLCDLETVRVTVPTPRGEVRACLRAGRDGVEGEVTTPHGVRVRLPNPQACRRVEICAGHDLRLQNEPREKRQSSVESAYGYTGSDPHAAKTRPEGAMPFL
ncbi:MAG: hypothetical protein PHR35_03770 [Kiritimatiellae bacterium]|nr:hypothetical protein [Kiritimatiellia bacterium]